MKTWEIIKEWEKDNNKAFKCIDVSGNEKDCIGEIVKKNTIGQLAWYGDKKYPLYITDEVTEWEEVKNSKTTGYVALEELTKLLLLFQENNYDFKELQEEMQEDCVASNFCNISIGELIDCLSTENTYWE